jgi:hypothetical protein
MIQSNIVAGDVADCCLELPRRSLNADQYGRLVGTRCVGHGHCRCPGADGSRARRRLADV